MRRPSTNSLLIFVTANPLALLAPDAPAAPPRRGKLCTLTLK